MRSHSLRIGRYGLVILTGCFAASSAGATIWTWSEQPVPVGEYRLDDVAASPTAVVAVGHDDETILRSTDGKNWDVIGLDPPGFLDHVSYLDGVFVAAGQTGLRYSTDDGLTWQAPAGLEPGGLNSVTRHDDSWMAFRFSGPVPRPVILQSDDLEAWELVTEPPMALVGLNVNRAATNGQTLVVAGWLSAPSGPGPRMQARASGEEWQTVTPDHGGSYMVIHDGSRFLGNGTGSGPPFVNRSIDGFDWERLDFPELGDGSILRIQWGNGGYLAVLNREGSDGALVFSTDLESWGTEKSLDYQVRSVVAFQGGWIGVGDRILRGEPASSSAIPALSPAGLALLLLVLGGAGVLVARFRASESSATSRS